MQPWYRITIGGEASITKKGALRPISVAIKIRQGRKASTLITGIEPFQHTAEALAEALRVRCASSTSGMFLSFWMRNTSLSKAMCTVSPVAGGGHEVMVQGKQIPAVLELLGSLGVPKKWIEVSDLADKKKK
jgi:translation initiation factor 2D